LQIGAKVRALRTARRLTQAQLARELKVAQGRLSDLELGKASLTAEQFLHILRIFNVPASEFMPSAGGVEQELQNALDCSTTVLYYCETNNRENRGPSGPSSKALSKALPFSDSVRTRAHTLVDATHGERTEA
jgi:transcriptional regulator with XRE-family HTH domain